MKIIRQGIDPKTVSKEVECSNCKTLYEVKRNELKYHSDQLDGNYYSFTCSVCDATVTLGAASFLR